jgi:hypothetical protein
MKHSSLELLASIKVATHRKAVVNKYPYYELAFPQG